MATTDPYIKSLAETHHLHRGTDTDDLAIRALTAEIRHLAVRAKIAGSWTVENFTPGGQPRAGADYRLDAYIRSLLDRHRLRARAGENDAALTHRAMLAELGQIKHRAQAAQHALRRRRRPKPRP
jgi:hypothetical protein